MFLRKNICRYCKYFWGRILYPVQGRCARKMCSTCK